MCLLLYNFNNTLIIKATMIPGNYFKNLHLMLHSLGLTQIKNHNSRILQKEKSFICTSKMNLYFKRENRCPLFSTHFFIIINAQLNCRQQK